MITLFGAPGAGKTIQGQLLAQKFGWEWVSYRDLLAKLNDRDISFALEHGMFIDDDKAVKAMDAALTSFKRTKKRLVLDGYPADYRQLQWLIDNGQIKDLEGAIILRVPRGELWRRLIQRGRVDDTRAAIERRQDLYDRNITGMIKALRMNNIQVREVDGGNEPEDVLARIEEVLADWDMVPKKQYAKISEKIKINKL